MSGIASAAVVLCLASAVMQSGTKSENKKRNRADAALDEKKVRHVCTYEGGCGKDYASESGLLAHVKDKHLGMPRRRNELRVLPCKLCSYSTTQVGHFKRHKLTHFKDPRLRPYQCDVENCGYSCNQKEDFKEHKQRHANLKEFKCNVPKCGYAANTSRDLANHKKGPHKQ